MKDLPHQTDFKVFTINETWYCPIRCSYCHVTKKADLSDKTILSKANLRIACSQAKGYDFDEYRFSGGEPTVIKDKLFEDANIVREIAGRKPVLLTSGYGLSEEWCRNAENLFSNIYISSESPILPYHKKINPDLIVELIKNYSSKKVPLKLGLTLIRPEGYKQLYDIFSYFYEGTNYKSFPQLSSPSLKDYVHPTSNQLEHLQTETEKIFLDYGIIPFYFACFIGTSLFYGEKIDRYVVNVNPDGQYSPFNSISEALDNEILASLKRKNERRECVNCEWADSCNPWDTGVDAPDAQLCQVRKAIFSGIYKGLSR